MTDASKQSVADDGLTALLRRSPPANPEAERALLGALLTNNKAYERVSDFLVAAHFADPLHGRIFEAIARRIDRGMLADPITMRAEFEHSGLLDEVGGPQYLGQLLMAMVGIVNAGDYGRAIHDAWIRRSSSISARTSSITPMVLAPILKAATRSLPPKKRSSSWQPTRDRMAGSSPSNAP